MNNPTLILIMMFLFIGCQHKVEDKAQDGKIPFNQKLADELKRMEEVDQIAAYIPQGEYTKMSDEQWSSFKDSVFVTHQKRIAEIFDLHGFVGYDLAGKEGSDNFWVLVQHSDHLPNFQREVLSDMKKHVDKGNATPSYYAYLVDRVNLNNGAEQIYGTQFTYNEIGQAIPKNMTDTTGIDNRRKSLGLKPMIERMNEMTISHFTMNEESYKNNGITKPQLHK